eukprot:gene11190-12478_t
MSAIQKINNSGLSCEEKIKLKVLIGNNVEIKTQIMEDDQVTDALLRNYLQGGSAAQQQQGENMVLADLTEQLSEIKNAVTYLVDERKNERRTVKKDGSKASVGDYNRFFSFSIFPAEGWLANNAVARPAFRTSACPLIAAHQLAMKGKLGKGLAREVEDVQPESKALLQQLMDLYFAGEQVRLISERPYSCKVTNRALESVVYSGKTDAVIKSSEYDVAVLCWEVKNQRIDLRDGGEIAQTAAEVSGELENMLNRFDIKPRKYAAVLTNGVSFLFVMATLINGVYSWTHSLLVTSAAAAARMIEGCFAIADEVLRLLTETFEIPMVRLRLEDDNDGNDANYDPKSSGGGGGDPKKSGSLAAIGRQFRSAFSGAAGSKTGTEAKKKHKAIGQIKSGNSQDYRYAPLTMSNVDLFNKMWGK